MQAREKSWPLAASSRPEQWDRTAHADRRWSLNERLSQAVRNEIAQRSGTVRSYTLFTGHLPPRMRGEMRSFQVLGHGSTRYRQFCLMPSSRRSAGS